MAGGILVWSGGVPVRYRGDELVGSPAAGHAPLVRTPEERTLGRLVVTPAALAPVVGHSHQLWLVPAEGNPHSLGLVTPGDARRIAVPAALVRTFAADATIAISAEQEGGSPTGQPAGPIVATGKLRPV